MGALSNLATGHFMSAKEQSERAETVFRERCTGAYWELSTARFVLTASLAWLGEWKESGALTTKFLKDARSRGDLYTLTQLILFGPGCIPDILVDRPDSALEDIREALGQWQVRVFSMQYIYSFHKEQGVLLYKGDAQEAWRRNKERWPRIRWSSLYLQSRGVRILALQTRARSAVAAATAGGPGSHELLEIALKLARKISREKLPWAIGWADVIRAGVEATRGNSLNSMRLAASAEAALRLVDMKLDAAVARWCRGRLLGGAEGKELVESAEAFMQTQNISKPERIAAWLMPGKWTREEIPNEIVHSQGVSRI
jgi:hypothetical protein